MTNAFKRYFNYRKVEKVFSKIWIGLYLSL